MGKINTGRFVVGGLIAGLVFNIGEWLLWGVVFSNSWKDWATQHSFPTAMGTWGMILMIILVFLLGIFAVWLYAAIRPRYKPGATTAIYAGLAVWFAAAFYPLIGTVFMHMHSLSTVIIVLIWELVELLLGTYLGAWYYREEAAAAAAAPE
jgi:heme A synthase